MKFLIAAVVVVIVSLIAARLVPEPVSTHIVCVESRCTSYQKSVRVFRGTHGITVEEVK